MYDGVIGRLMLPYPAWLMYRSLHHLPTIYNFRDIGSCPHSLWACGICFTPTEGQQANPGIPVKWLMKTIVHVCVCVCFAVV